MEEKKEIKISLTTLFLIIAIILIVIMGIYIFNLYKANQKSESSINELNTKISTLENSITEQKDEENIANTINQISSDNVINNSNESNNTNYKIDENYYEKNTQSDETKKSVKYEFSSADNSAAKGNPEVLKVYELTENELNFEYNSGFDFEKSTIDRNVEGSAKITSGKVYEYEENISNHKYKLSFEFNSKEDTVKIVEYDNNKKISEVNLYR